MASTSVAWPNPWRIASAQQLLLERIRSTSGHYRSAAQDQRTLAFFDALAQPKTGAPVNPVPPLRFLALLAQFFSLSPLLLVTFPNIPSVQFDDQGEGLHRLV